MMSLASRLSSLKSSNGMTTEELSIRSGVPVGTINKILNGETQNPTAKTMAKLAAILDSSVEFLYGNQKISQSTAMTIELSAIKNPEDILPIKRQRIPLLGEIACGIPSFADENFESYVEVGTEIRCDFALRAKGDSMINARIYDGDIVFIRKQSMVDNGEIAAVLIEDEATLKRVYYEKQEQKLLLCAENSKYPPIVVEGEALETVTILGKAVAFQSDVN